LDREQHCLQVAEEISMGRSQMSFAKRQREQARRDKAQQKKEKRAQKKTEPTDGSDMGNEVVVAETPLEDDSTDAATEAE
jgi:hypothetical protein